MKMVVEKLVDGEQEFEVVEAENVPQAINMCDKMVFDSEGEVVHDNRSIGYVGVYEVGQTNLLDFISDRNAVHSFYNKRLKEVGIDSTTFEKL